MAFSIKLICILCYCNWCNLWFYFICRNRNWRRWVDTAGKALCESIHTSTRCPKNVLYVMLNKFWTSGIKMFYVLRDSLRSSSNLLKYSRSPLQKWLTFNLLDKKQQSKICGDLTCYGGSVANCCFSDWFIIHPIKMSKSK